MTRLALAVVALLALVGPARAASTVSEDGKSATDGRRTLTVSQARDIDPAGAVLTVDGSGYDNTKGIYVAFCVVPPEGTPPGPCGGGQDRSGATGESVWVSSNPPLYARGLTTPYGKGGTFHVQIHVQAQLNENVDCRKVLCAVSTRNDHTRSSDRSQDVLVPIYFVGGITPTTVAPGAPPTTAPAARGGVATTTTTIAQQLLAAPLATVSDDRRSVSGGGKTLRASETELKPGAEVRVHGRGYDTTKGVYVSLCFINEANAPGPCASGSADQSAWISSNPPDYGKDLAQPYADGGSFAVTLTLDPIIDAEHDCSQVACALATRNDDTHPDDRSQDLMLPVSFASDNAAAPAEVEPSEESSVNSAAVITGVAALVAVAAAIIVVLRKRRPA